MYKKKTFFLVIITMILFTQIACTKNTVEKEDCMINKLWYADFLDFILYMNIDGQWYIGNMFNEARRLVSPHRESFVDFYTEVQFIINPKERFGLSETIIVAWPNPDNAQGIINAINWDILSSGENLESTLVRFGVPYPLTVESLVNDWCKIDALMNRNSTSNFNSFLAGQFARAFGNEGTRIAFELLYLNSSSESGEERIYYILNQLNLTEDEGAIILRQAGSYNGFIFITNLMHEEGLSFERALRRYQRRTTSNDLMEQRLINSQHDKPFDSLHASTIL